ncbi:uncharacterized protein RJT20DRAFT_65558 [Scheffersomyces xylosifermentans]|uniref:uncharacterized protein n=1 Tax=Scheffersomyces xylosifermentans TaxID=1304137 RepID=UPI00315DCF3A
MIVIYEVVSLISYVICLGLPYFTMNLFMPSVRTSNETTGDMPRIPIRYLFLHMLWITTGYVLLQRTLGDISLWGILLFMGLYLPTWYLLALIKGDAKLILHLQIVRCIKSPEPVAKSEQIELEGRGKRKNHRKCHCRH